ncbi:hypothetical protein KY289_023227 [Solanum tuberosum]|nr:hypothetical protein KY289_023227 [Solanum tuberosum]
MDLLPEGELSSAVDTHTGKKVAIKKINNVLEHVSEATRNGHMILVFSVFLGPGTSNWGKEPATLYASLLLLSY